MIAFGSISRGTGTTFVCLALANFLCSKQGMKTAYIELNTTNQIRSLSPDFKKVPFRHLGVDIFPEVKVTSLWEILRMDYDYFLLDMGVLNTYTAKEFSKCHQQFLVCNLSKWNYHSVLENVEYLLKNVNLLQEHVTVLCNLSMKKSELSTYSMYKLKMISFPFIQNPFQLEPKMFEIFTKLLERNNVQPKI